VYRPTPARAYSPACQESTRILVLIATLGELVVTAVMTAFLGSPSAVEVWLSTPLPPLVTSLQVPPVPATAQPLPLVGKVLLGGSKLSWNSTLTVAVTGTDGSRGGDSPAEFWAVTR